MLVPQKASSQAILYVETTNNNSERDVPRLFRDWASLSALSDFSPNVLVDFSYCEFLNHLGVAFLGGLACLTEHLGGSVTFKWESLDAKILTNLAQNGFLQSFGHKQHPWDGNSIPYRRDLNHDSHALGDYLHSKWLGKGWVNISPGLQASITGKVSEIYLNAFEHSRSPIGVFSCGQHYPNLGWLHLTAVDFGVGIPRSVRSLPQNQSLSSADALRWAFQTGTSTKSGEKQIGRGLGLHFLQSFVNTNQGALRIFSNDSCISMDNNGVSYKNTDIDFAGTLVDIAFRCDESYYRLASEAGHPDEPWF